MKNYIIIHHSLTKDGDTVSWGAIRRYHMEERGWDDIGYHFGIERINGRYEVLIGRMPNVVGAHCKELGMNSNAFGVCLVGNFDEAPPHPDQLFATQLLCAFLCREYHIPPANILGHRDIGLLIGYDWKAGQYKSCPGKLFDIESFRIEVAKMTAHAT
jgi:hypothetical protein